MPKLSTLKPRVTEAPARVRPLTVAATIRPRGRAWQKLAGQVLREAGGRCECEACAAARWALPAHEVDHVTELADGGAATDRANLRAINRECHERKTREAAARRAGRLP